MSDAETRDNDRLLAIGNGNAVDDRSDLLTGYKKGTLLAPSLTNELIDAEETGKVLVTKEWVNSNSNKIVQGTFSPMVWAYYHNGDQWEFDYQSRFKLVGNRVEYWVKLYNLVPTGANIDHANLWYYGFPFQTVENPTTPSTFNVTHINSTATIDSWNGASFTPEASGNGAYSIFENGANEFSNSSIGYNEDSVVIIEGSYQTNGEVNSIILNNGGEIIYD